MRSVSRVARGEIFLSTYAKIKLCGSLCKLMCMATNLQIDEALIQEALALGNHQTKRAVVEAALREYVQRRKQMTILELFGTIDFDEDYDYKQQRQKQ